MRASRSTVRLACCLLAYTLTASLLAPPPSRSTASPAASRPTGGAARAVAPGRVRSDAPSRVGELLVRFSVDVTERGKDEITSSRGVRRKGKLRGESRVEKLELQPGQELAAEAERLRRQPGVEFVEPNFLVGHDQMTPTDARFSEQWALRNAGQSGGAAGSDVRAPAAWQETVGAYSTVVAVVDGGIDFMHPDLAASRWLNPGEEADNGLDDERDGYPDDVSGWDWVANSGVIRDEQGHGTAVAGIIAAEGNNNRGVAGVMWRASLMSLRVLDSAGTGDVASAVEAIDYAVAHGASVVNCSWGTDADSQLLKEAIERAGRKGVVVVASAGNAGRDLDSQPYYPASYDLPNLIAVASSDGFDNLATFSNRGAARVGVAAPGTDILTTQSGGDYRFVSGTSASAPMVAGIAGLIKTVRPSTNAAAVRTAVLDGARRVDALTGKVSSGGVADAAGALAALRGNPYAGNGNGNGNGPGNGQGNGRPYVPPALRHDNDQGRAKGKQGVKVTPPEPRAGAPLGGLPDLAESRKVRTSPTPPEPPAVIHSDLACADCNPSGGGAGDYIASDPYVGTARSRPANEVGTQGVNIGSRNFNWGVPLVSLPGRAGLDLSVSLYYNSLVWARQETGTQSIVVYNADHGTPSPGFQLGMPRLQALFYNTDAAAYAYMMITPSGGRVEMRQTGTAGLYESADSTYTQLTFAGSTPVVRTTDGAQYVFGTQVAGGAEWRCTQVKDRNGNYISASYNASNGHVLSMTDTLGRVVNFNYNAGTGLLESITQSWGGATHTHASFYYADRQFALSFVYYLPVVGAQNGSTQTVLDKVVLSNGEAFNFDYNGYGQVYQIRRSTPGGQELGRTRYDLTNAEISGHTPDLVDCPRFTQQRVWARYWNGDTDGTYSAAEEALTTYSKTYVADFTHPVTGEQMSGFLHQETAPDGTIYKRYVKEHGWDKELPQITEEWPVEVVQGVPQNVKRKWASYVWTHDNQSPYVARNPRLAETNVHDPDGNRRQTTVEYNSGYSLPTTVREWGKVNGQMVLLRRTVTDYQLGGDYLNARVIGLPWQKQVYDGGGALVSKQQFYYDWGGWHLEDISGVTIPQHDPAYGTSYTAGRGNLVLVQRFDVTDPDNLNKKVEFKYRYNKTGSMIGTMDAGFHQVNVAYADSFSDDNNSRNTYAYPTTVTDAEGISSTTQYNYDFGAVTRTHAPSSGTGSGITYVDVATSYYPDGRPQQETVTPGGAYQRWVFDDNLGYLHTFETITGTAQADEFHSWRLFDGAGRVRASAFDHPGSAGGFSGAYAVYDKLGRVVESSNPTEIDQNWNPVGDDVLNTSQNTGGWRVTLQTYDWKGRARVTTNADGTTRVLDYGGCGCAGGEVTTAQDEHGRQKRYTKDQLGRLAKVEELNWNGTVYSTTQHAYNARDQIKEINHAGQLRTFDYDGHGRLSQKTTPEQGTTTYTYYADDTVHVVTDARNVTATYTYTSRHQISNVDYNAPLGSGAANTVDVGYLYDAAGNRFWMSDGEGYTFTHYDALGRPDWEERNFTNVGTYRLSYDYNPAGQLKKITYPWQFGGAEVSYGYDRAGRLDSVGGTGYSSGLPYASSITYRAFGGVKGMNYGDGKSLTTSYDRRLRATKWDVAGVLGYKYYYDDFNEHTGRVTFAQHITGQNPALDRTQTASSLDRSYEYDHVGRLSISHAGAEARAHSFSGQWGTADGHYSQGYDYDMWGNLTHRYGWGGEVQQGSPASSTDLYYTYATGANGVVNNRRAGNFTYDNSGNLTYDGGQHFTYDAQGNQVEVDWMSIQQGYDGDGLRVRRSANGPNPARYLRSSVLGGQVVAEINYVNNSSWQFVRGYVYAGAGLLAVQQGNSSVAFVHEDPVTKGKRVTDTSGAPQPLSALELDPFGAEAGGSNTAFQPRKFTTYERDPNGSDEAMMRRYNRWHARFDQPDPYDDSSDLADPQSLNRYSYVQNDPVNHVDPTGLMCFDITRTDIYTDTGGIAGGPWRVGSFCTDWGGYFPQERTGPWVDPEEFEKEFGPPPPSPWNCGVNPITNTPRINAVPSGNIGELRRGIGGDGRFNSRGGRHQAIDIRAPVGTPAHANRSGEVVRAIREPGGGYGNAIVIRHSENAYTFYAHLRDAPSLGVGDLVNEGEVIGYAGRTGNPPPWQLASEDHLHFGFKSSPITLVKGERFNDPVAYLNGPCPP